MSRGTSEPPKKIIFYRRLADDLENLFIIYVWILDTRMLSRDQLLKLQYMVRSAPRTKKVMTLWRGLKEPNRFAHVGIVCPRDKPCMFNMPLCDFMGKRAHVYGLNKNTSVLRR